MKLAEAAALFAVHVLDLQEGVNTCNSSGGVTQSGITHTLMN